MQDATVLGGEQDPITLREGTHSALKVEKDTRLVSPVPEAVLCLEVDDHAPHICSHALEVEQATDRNPRLRVTHNHRVGATHDHKAGIIVVPEVEQGTLDLGVDHQTQCLRLEPGKTGLTTQTTMKQ